MGPRSSCDRSPASGALGALFEQARPGLVGLARARLGDLHEAEDLVSDLFLLLVARRLAVDPARGSPLTLLRTVLDRRAIDRVRRRASRAARGGEALDAARGVEPDASAAAAGREALEGVEAALRRAPEPDRRLLAALAVGSTPSEVARCAGVSPLAIRLRLLRARRRLAQALSLDAAT